MTLEPLEVTDYLIEHFPPYIPTEDTAVKLFKNYFVKDGRVWNRILAPSATANPKTSGWYEASRNHYEEYRHHCDSIKVNNIGVLAQILAAWMSGNKLNHPGFPVDTLPRTISGVDWSSNFHDTRFQDVVGSTPVPPFAVTFNTNLEIAKNINALVRAIAENLGELQNLNHWSRIEEVWDPQTLVDDSIGLVRCTYSDFDYHFFPESLGSIGRIDDTYTLVSLWSRVAWRQAFMMVQEAIRFLRAVSNNDYVTSSKIEAWERLLDLMDRSARTVAHIAKLVGSTVIVDAAKFEEKLVADVPPTMMVNGTIMYRLAFNRQLVAGATYGKLVSDWAGNIELVEIGIVPDPTVRFAHITPLPVSGDPPVTMTLPYHYMQTGNVWYTTVPFTG